jgi:hypothetical protein
MSEEALDALLADYKADPNAPPPSEADMTDLLADYKADPNAPLPAEADVNEALSLVGGPGESGSALAPESEAAITPAPVPEEESTAGPLNTSAQTVPEEEEEQQEESAVAVEVPNSSLSPDQEQQEESAVAVEVPNSSLSPDQEQQEGNAVAETSSSPPPPAPEQQEESLVVERPNASSPNESEPVPQEEPDGDTESIGSEKQEEVVPVIDVKVSEARGLGRVVDCLMKVSVIGHPVVYRTPSTRSASPKWEDTYSFIVENPEIENISVELFDWRDPKKPLGRGQLPARDGDVWVPLSEEIEARVEVRVRWDVPKREVQDVYGEETTVEEADEAVSSETTDREQYSSAFVRLCGLDPAQLRREAREQARAVYKEAVIAKKTTKGIPADRTLERNHELVETLRETSVAGLKEKIARTGQAILTIDEEIQVLEAAILRLAQARQNGV